MKPHRNVVVQYVTPAGPELELLEQVDELVLAAARGDVCALSAVVVTFGGTLLAVARRELGGLREPEAEDAVQELYTALALGTHAGLVLVAPGDGLPWLKRMARQRACAQRQRRGVSGAPKATSPWRGCRW